ncbi:MAG: PEP-utilizing enzyme [Desulfobacterales bacterium]|jgi:pyruvate,orthophosphate dikinase|nr:PEP-utilizing enzyme [Desulfobacterales bacterium]
MDAAPKVKSKALEVNLADYHVEVAVDPKYAVLQEVLSKYYGLMEGLNTFLGELSHPYLNWRFIVSEARKYALDYFHLFRQHPRGPDAARLVAEILITAVRSARSGEVASSAVDNLLLYLQTILRESDADFGRFRPVVSEAFAQMHQLPEEAFGLVVRSYYPVKRLAAAFMKRSAASREGFAPLHRLLARYFDHTYAYWLSESDPEAACDREAAEFGGAGACDDLFDDISHRRIRAWQAELLAARDPADPDSREAADRLLALPGFDHFVGAYKKIPQQLLQRGAAGGRGRHLKLIFLFQMMNVAGLALIHEETLRDINQTLTWIIVNENYRNIQQLIRKTFSILKERSQSYPATALTCVLNMGRGVYKTDDIDLLNFFIDALIDFGFQSPSLQGVDDEWRIRVNSSHLLNIRTWLELIKLNPKRSTRLLSALVIHLSVGGVLIRDIDLFPRDVTGLLNSPVHPAYHLVKQLARLCPVFFNDIGAEGRLRDVSTRIDELSQRRDVLVHFLRKQSHVESSNQIIPFMEAAFRFWQTQEKEGLAPFVPPSIFDQIDSRGPHVKGLHRVMQRLVKKGVRIPDDLLTLPPEDLASRLGYVPGVSTVDIERFELAVEFYKLLCQKYRFGIVELENYLSQLRPEALPELSRLEQALAETDAPRRMALLLGYLETLKAVITSDAVYDIREDIYQKRHITIDIPSMYGSYHEMKFDCLGLTLRLEAIVNALFESLIRDIDLTLITQATFGQIHQTLQLFDQALRLDGIRSAEFERQLEFLRDSLAVKGFTLTQYLDIFKGFAQAVQNIIKDHFNNLHGANLNRILPQLPAERVLPKYLPREPLEDRERLNHRIAEIFFRDQIAGALGLQQLDLFLGRILNTLFQQSYKLPQAQLRQLLLYDPHTSLVAIDSPHSCEIGVIHLGTKGFNLVRLHDLGFRVPPGFVVTTEVFRCREVIESYAPAQRYFHEQITRHLRRLEQATGKVFGDPANPLLLSVRSGSAISQPGMMDTLLDVGNNLDIAAGVAGRTGNAWFAWDNYRRFLQNYGMAHDMTRDDFDAVIADGKRRWGIPLKRHFSGEQMREVALAYRRLIEEAGIEMIDSPIEQLLLAIRRVLASWESPKALAYRCIMGISDDWGTAIAIQAMVYGNVSPEAGTGVIFTHNPRWSGDVLKLWGDFTTANQGEDVVSGLVRTMPISLFQQDIEMRETDVTLETHFPEIYRELKRWAHALIDDHGWSPQEIEFTFEGPSAADLYMLQTRDMAIRESPKVLTFDFEAPPHDLLLGHGIGVSGGAMSGRLVFGLEDIEAWRVREPSTHLILARTDTVPDDIREINAADGLLTARGGLTSHAAVVAHRLGKTCVAGCGSMECSEREKVCTFPTAVLKAGDCLSMDGQEGSVYRGIIRVKEA